VTDGIANALAATDMLHVDALKIVGAVAFEDWRLIVAKLYANYGHAPIDT